MHYSLFLLQFSFLLLSLVLRAEGHGFVHTVVVNGKEYPGWNPFSDPYNNPGPRVTRKVGSDGFVAGSDADLACHHGGDTGTAAVAEAQAGSEVIFHWAYWPGDHQGPVSTYMTSCDGDCSSFSANNAKWFKVDASGYSANDRQWAAAKLITDGMSWTSTIPSNLTPGEYLIRNEIVALHSITPQFYPSCTQIKVTGSGTGTPSSAEQMTMQQIYSGADWPNIYLSDNLGSFVIPGPPIARLGEGGSTTPDPTSMAGSVANSSRTMGSTRPTPTRTASTSTRTSATAAPQQTPSTQCLLKSRRLVRRR